MCPKSRGRRPRREPASERGSADCGRRRAGPSVQHGFRARAVHRVLRHRRLYETETDGRQLLGREEPRRNRQPPADGLPAAGCSPWQRRPVERSRNRNTLTRRLVDRDMVYLLTLPFRILFGLVLLPFALLALPFALLLLPFLILRFVVKAAVALVVLPFVLFIGVIVCVALAIAFSLAILVPLLPFALLAFFVWAVVHRSEEHTSELQSQSNL